MGSDGLQKILKNRAVFGVKIVGLGRKWKNDATTPALGIAQFLPMHGSMQRDMGFLRVKQGWQKMRRCALVAKNVPARRECENLPKVS